MLTKNISENKIQKYFAKHVVVEQPNETTMGL